MSTTVIDNLWAAGATPSGSYLRGLGGIMSGGTIQPLQRTPAAGLMVDPTPAMTDAFNRLRASEPISVFEGKQVFDNAPFLYATSLTGGGTATYSSGNASTTMALTTANGDQVIRQSKQYLPYQPGKSQLIFLTGVMGAAKANVRQRMGYFDANDGLFLEQTSTAKSVVQRSNVTGTPVDTAITQTNWNIDKLDGSGASGITLDLSKATILVIDFEWLGMGSVRFGFVINGRIIYCHQINNANNLTTVYMRSPCLPVRWEITNTAATASATSMLQTCAAVISEGGYNPKGYAVSVANTTARNFTGPVPCISVRLKSAYNRAYLIPFSFDAMTTSASSFLAQVVIGGTLTGATFNATSGSASEFDVAATAITGGVTVASLLVSTNRRAASDLVDQALVCAADVAGTTDILSLVITSLAGGASNFFGSLAWREYY